MEFHQNLDCLRGFLKDCSIDSVDDLMLQHMIKKYASNDSCVDRVILDLERALGQSLSTHALKEW